MINNVKQCNELIRISKINHIDSKDCWMPSTKKQKEKTLMTSILTKKK